MTLFNLLSNSYKNSNKSIKYKRKLFHFTYNTTLAILLILLIQIEITLGSRKFLTGLIIGTLLGKLE